MLLFIKILLIVFNKIVFIVSEHDMIKKNEIMVK